MNKNCIVIPVHWQKVNWFVMFLQSIQIRRIGLGIPDFDLILAASNFQEKKMLLNLPPIYIKNLNIVVICIDDYIDTVFDSTELRACYAENRDGAVVTLKKLCAMKYAAEAGYENILSIDSDVLAWTDFDGLFTSLEKNYLTRNYYGKISLDPTHSEIMKNCIGFFAPDEQDRLRELTLDGRCYSWFFDAPFYKADDLKGFFDHLTSQHGNIVGWLSKVSWFTFEHLVFQYYSILHRSCKLIECSDLVAADFLEYATVRDFEKIKQRYGYTPVWLFANHALQDRSTAEALPGIHLLLHFDRF